MNKVLETNEITTFPKEVQVALSEMRASSGIEFDHSVMFNYRMRLIQAIFRNSSTDDLRNFHSLLGTPPLTAQEEEVFEQL